MYTKAAKEEYDKEVRRLSFKIVRKWRVLYIETDRVSLNSFG